MYGAASVCIIQKRRMKTKKRYNKFIAYLLVDCSIAVILGLVFLVMNFVAAEPVLPTSDALLMIVIGVVAVLLLTLYINSRTPKEERVQTWLSAWWVGFRIAIKISLFFTLILIPLMLKWSIESAADYVEDESGDDYMVLDGSHVVDRQGNQYEVQYDANREPYIEASGRRINFKQ